MLKLESIENDLIKSQSSKQMSSWSQRDSVGSEVNQEQGSISTSGNILFLMFINLIYTKNYKILQNRVHNEKLSCKGNPPENNSTLFKKLFTL